jgi:hypothetical protein
MVMRSETAEHAFQQLSHYARGARAAARPSAPDPARRPSETAAPRAENERLGTRVAEAGGVGAIALIFVGFLVPDDISLFIGDIRLPIIRLMILLLMLPAAVGFLNHRGGRLHTFDIAFFAFVLWTVMCIIGYRGAGGIQEAGVYGVEWGVTYVVAVAFAKTMGRLRAILNALILIVMVLGLFAMAEALTNTPYMANFGRQVMGIPPLIPSELPRLGMMRARTVFSHPILYGVFAASMISFAWYLTPNLVLRMVKTGGVAVATFFSLSAGGLAVMAIQLMAIAGDIGSKGIPQRFKLITLGLTLVLVFVHFAAESGVYRLVQLITLDGGSAFYRTLIWEHGIDDVMRNPLFGLRPETWTRLYWMPLSIDNFWLAQAMRGGIPSVVFFFTALIIMLRVMFRSPDSALPPTLAALRRAWAFAMAGIVIGGATVFFFDKIPPYLGLLMGFGAAICRMVMDFEKASQPVAASVGRERRAAL